MARNLRSLGIKDAKAALGITDMDATFQRFYGDHGIPTKQVDNEGLVTVPRQELLRHSKHREAFRGFAAKSLGHLAQRVKDGAPPTSKALDESVFGTNTATGAIPLVYDPDIMDILKAEAPVLDMIPEEGQRGYKAVINNITARDAPLGYRTETESSDLTGETPSDLTIDQLEFDMKIWVDLLTVTEFTQRAGEHYVDVRDTGLGARLAEYGQATERDTLYGDPTLATNTGSFGDSDGVEGYESLITTAGNRVDKSTTNISGTKALSKDIKAEIKDMLQGSFAVNKNDLFIATSWTVFDELQNELDVAVRIDSNDRDVDFSSFGVRINGVPVVPTHNVDQHTDDGNNTGDEGDVFILNRREVARRLLMPLSVVPLGTRGFSQEIAMGEFGAPVMKGNGKLSKYLEAYQV